MKETDSPYAPIQRLEAENAELKRRILCFETAMDLLPDGYVVVGRDGNILYINQSYCEAFGVTREQATGMPITKLIPNTKLIETMDEDKIEIDVLHEFPEGLTVSGESKVVSTRIPIKIDGKIIASAALSKFSPVYAKIAAIHPLLGRGSRVLP